MAKVLSCGVGFMRGILLLLNVFFALVGLGLIGLGIYVKVDNKISAVLSKFTEVSSFSGQSLGFLAFVLIGGGIFTILIAISGCLGSLWRNRCLLYLYAIVLGVLMIIELVGFILAFVYKDKLEDVYRKTLTTVFVNALIANDTKVLDAFHDMEESLQCCGVNGKTDYTEYGKDAPSWCYEYQQGCSTIIINTLKKNLPIIGGSLGAVLFLELLSFIGAIVLAVALKHAPDDIDSSSPRDVIAQVIPGRRRNYYKLS
ncbi:unnamed protein product [Rotaria sp. Silwood1]|nr:unnamed protein product [Rotaria sp. Silwood1]CAF3330671.1 unnamed protein product [Rotaria sp. Silwood1]CAF3349683.1 unnamed protein product [Rotaria sp. Silwood1]CAF4700100.1 unnamed protein product [Rotaria sp. Silwood1]CAF4852598.1 unnamed protein product [Rotaria sp. Silwood1]